MFRPSALKPIFGPAMMRRSFTTSHKLSDVARLTLIGRMGQDPEFQTTVNGNSLVKYSIGTSFGVGEQRRTSWYRIACFDEKGREILETLGKGSLIYVEGDIELKLYEGEDGKKQTFVNVIQRHISPIYRKPIGGEPVEGVAAIEGQSPAA